jgi:hypothetical protein
LCRPLVGRRGSIIEFGSQTGIALAMADSVIHPRDIVLIGMPAPDVAQASLQTLQELVHAAASPGGRVVVDAANLPAPGREVQQKSRRKARPKRCGPRAAPHKVPSALDQPSVDGIASSGKSAGSAVGCPSASAAKLLPTYAICVAAHICYLGQSAVMRSKGRKPSDPPAS